MDSSLKEQLKQALAECERLRSENEKLQSLFGQNAILLELKKENAAHLRLSRLIFNPQ